MYKQPIDLVLCNYCGRFVDLRDDRDPKYRVTTRFNMFVYACISCFEDNKEKKGGKKWISDTK